MPLVPIAVGLLNLLLSIFVLGSVARFWWQHRKDGLSIGWWILALAFGVFVVSDLLLVTEITPPERDDITSRRDLPVTPLYGALNVEWAPKALYPQPRAHMQQQLGYLDLMKQLIDKGVDPNARLKMKVLDEKYLLKRAAGHLIPASIRRRPKQPYRAPATPPPCRVS